MWLWKEPCRVAHGTNEGEASRRDIEEIKVRNNFSTIRAMLDCRKKLHWLKGLQMSFFLLISLFSCNFQPLLGAKSCSYAKTLQNMSWKDGVCDSEMNDKYSSVRISSDTQHLLGGGGVRAASSPSGELCEWTHIQHRAGASLMASCFVSPVTQVPRKQSILSHTSKWLISPKWAQPNLD